MSIIIINQLKELTKNFLKARCLFKVAGNGLVL